MKRGASASRKKRMTTRLHVGFFMSERYGKLVTAYIPDNIRYARLPFSVRDIAAARAGMSTADIREQAPSPLPPVPTDTNPRGAFRFDSMYHEYNKNNPGKLRERETPRQKVRESSRRERPVRKNRSAGVILFVLVAVIAVVAAFYNAQAREEAELAAAEAQQAAQPTEPTHAPDYCGIAELSFEDASDGSVGHFKAGAVPQPDAAVASLLCELTDESGAVVYSETVSGASGEWTVENLSGTFGVRVTATAADGTQKTETSSVTFNGYNVNAFFGWPAEPRYEQLVYDTYQVSAGEETIEGLTHNNGKTRAREYVYGGSADHTGYDIVLPKGTPVAAAADGVVEAHYTDGKGLFGMGECVVLRHEGTGRLEGHAVYTLYAHLGSVSAEKGAEVKKGDVIAASGSSGGSRIPHLHFEMRIDANDSAHAVDPLEILPRYTLQEPARALDRADGFVTSEIDLYASILEKGYDYRLMAYVPKSITLAKMILPKGVEVEVLERKNGSVTFLYKGIKHNCMASRMQYVYDLG